MHIDVVGAGPDLVLLHGWAMHSGIFSPLTRVLAERFRLHLVDLPGHGASAPPDAPLELATIARELAVQTPSGAPWLGWSLGGLVALTGALELPTPPRALVLIATNPRFVIAEDWPCGVAHAVFESFAAGLREDYRRTIERFLALEALGSDDAQKELRELRRTVFAHGEPATPTLLDGLRLLETTDLRDALPRLTMPMLWIGGRRDRLVPLAAVEWAARHCANGQSLAFDSGHAPFIGHADAIADAVAMLLQ